MLEDLDDLLSDPTPEVVDVLGSLDGDIVVLGAGGKMGPTLARMARRASDEAGARREVFAASRFSSGRVRERLESWGIRTIRCDLLDRREVDRLPPSPNVVFMAGRKFGSTGNEELTWAVNVAVPTHVCERYRRSRIVAFSTGNVYGLAPVAAGGSVEGDALAAEGDYAWSCVGRERVFDAYSRRDRTPIVLLRLNYAVEPRYGVLVDLGRKVWAEESVDLSMGYFNTIWQPDANAIALRAFPKATAPPLVLNVTGPEILSVRAVCEEFGRLFGKEPRLEGRERPDALVSNAAKALELFGPPRKTAGDLVRIVADWILGGGRFLEKPTHFDVRDGRF